MPGPGNILIKVGADAGQAVRELSTVDKALDSTMTGSQKMGAGLKKAALPAAAALGAIGIAAVAAGKAAAEDAAEQEHLSGVLERVAGATDGQVAATEDWIAAQAKATGVSDSELRPALEKLATATGDVGEAQKLMKAAMDISAASGKDLNTVSVAIAKGHEGQTAALAKLVPGLSEAARSSKDFTVIMDELSTKTGGAMADSAATATGQYRIFTDQMGELQESLGAGLLPVMQALMPVLNRMADFAAQNTTVIKILVGVIAGLAAGILIANAAMKAYAAAQVIVKAATAAWTAAQWLLNAALSGNPIGLVIIAITALIAIIVVAYTKSDTFRSIVKGAMDAVLVSVRALKSGFDALVDAAQAAFSWITSHWKVGLFALGPIGIAIELLVTHFQTLKSVATSVFDAIASAISGIAGAIESVVGAVQRLIDAIGRIHVPHINLPGPFLAPAPAGASAGRSAGASSRASSAPVVVNVYGAIDPEGTARTIRRVLGDSDRRRGRTS